MPTTRTAATTAAERAAARVQARQDRIAELLGERPHAEQCPGETDHARLEHFDAQRPADPSRGTPSGPVLVVRCQACGGQRVREDMTARDLLA